MSSIWHALAVVCAALGAACLAPPPAWAQADSEFTLMRDWTPIGTVDFRAVADTLLLSEGTIHSNERYGDFAFRFDYRLPATDAVAALLVRAGAATDPEPREYAVALDGTGEGGRLSAV